MANTKISALTGASTPLAGTEVLPIVQSSATVKVSVANLTAGRAIGATSIQFGSGSVLSTYEEGTWTPNQGSGLTVVGAFSSAGIYTKVGRIVNVRGAVYAATSVACTSAGVISSNLPFAPSSDTAGSYFNGSLSAGGQVDAAPTGVYAVSTITATTGIYFSATYAV
jgi:hypothetical protein